MLGIRDTRKTMFEICGGQRQRVLLTCENSAS